MIGNSERKGFGRRGLCWLPLVLAVGACGEIGMIASPAQKFGTIQTAEFRRSNKDILNVAAETAKSLGYQTTAIDRVNGAIKFEQEASMLTGVLIGKINKTQIVLKRGSSPQSVSIEILAMGNFGTSGEEPTLKMLEEFKSEFVRRMNS